VIGPSARHGVMIADGPTRDSLRIFLNTSWKCGGARSAHLLGTVRIESVSTPSVPSR